MLIYELILYFQLISMFQQILQKELSSILQKDQVLSTSFILHKLICTFDQPLKLIIFKIQPPNNQRHHPHQTQRTFLLHIFLGILHKLTPYFVVFSLPSFPPLFSHSTQSNSHHHRHITRVALNPLHIFIRYSISVIFALSLQQPLSQSHIQLPLVRSLPRPQPHHSSSLHHHGSADVLTARFLIQQVCPYNITDYDPKHGPKGSIVNLCMSQIRTFPIPKNFLPNTPLYILKTKNLRHNLNIPSTLNRQKRPPMIMRTSSRIS